MGLGLSEADFAEPHKVAEKADQLWLSMGAPTAPAIHRASYPHSMKPRNFSSTKEPEWTGATTTTDSVQKQQMFKTVYLSGKLPGRSSVETENCCLEKL